MSTVSLLPRLRIDQYVSMLFIGILFFIIPIFGTVFSYSGITLPEKKEPAPIFTTVTIPERSSDAPQPELSAQGVIVIDETSGIILVEKNIHEKLPQASLTKLMTGYVASQHYDFDEVLTVNGEQDTVGNRMKLMNGEQMTVRDLVQGLLIFSGNDAAYVLANNYPGGYDAFIEKMNTTAVELELHNTSFSNPAGLDSIDQYTTAWDLAILTQAVMREAELRRYMGTRYASVTSVDGKYAHPLYTTNQLLYSIEGMVGGKTGSTELAKQCLVTKVTRDGKSIITVVLGSDDRFADTTELIEWTFANYEWTEITAPAYNID